MFGKRSLLIGWAILVLALILGVMNVSTVFAQGEAPVAGTACATCHERLYTLYDTGKWYCTCKRRADCTVCHAGQADTFDETLAHQGLFANPVQDNPGACQSCHLGDSEAYIQRFTQIAGVSGPRKPGSTYIPVALQMEEPVDASGALVLAGRSYAPWQLIGLGVLTGLLLGVFLFGCRCWRQDQEAGRL